MNNLKSMHLLFLHNQLFQTLQALQSKCIILLFLQIWVLHCGFQKIVFKVFSANLVTQVLSWGRDVGLTTHTVALADCWPGTWAPHILSFSKEQFANPKPALQKEGSRECESRRDSLQPRAFYNAVSEVTTHSLFLLCLFHITHLGGGFRRRGGDCLLGAPGCPP